MHAGSTREAGLELEEIEDYVVNYYNKIEIIWDELNELLAHTIWHM